MAIVELETRGDVAVITLARPEKLNAINDEMLDGLLDAIETIGRSEAIGAAVLTGRGRAFSAGGDITAMDGMDEPTFAATIARYMRVVGRFRACRMPIVAAGPRLRPCGRLRARPDVRRAVRRDRGPVRPARHAAGPQPDERDDLAAAAGRRSRPGDLPDALGGGDRRRRGAADRAGQPGDRSGRAPRRGGGVRASDRPATRGSAWSAPSAGSSTPSTPTSRPRPGPRRRPSSPASDAGDAGGLSAFADRKRS